MADEIVVDETGWPVVTNRQVQYPARVRIVPTAEDDVVDLEAVPGDVEAEGTDVGEGLFGAVRTYVDSRDGTKADGAYVEQEVGRVDGALAALGGRVDGVAGDVAALDGSKVSKAGDTMTGGLTLDGAGKTSSPHLRLTAEDSTLTDAQDSASMEVYLDGEGQARVAASHPANGVDRPQSAGVHNELVLGKDATTLKKPLTVASGGTGATNPAGACVNIIRG